jgi:hypothetical protein
VWLKCRVIVRTKIFLHQTSRDQLLRGTPPTRPATITRLPDPVPAFARFLYATVGRPCLWSSRLAWPDDRWAAHFADPHHELWVAWLDGNPIGFAELRVQSPGPVHATVEIRYMGLFPQFYRRKLGGQLLYEVTCESWRMHERVAGMATVGRVVLDTRDLDAGAALPNYLKKGYRRIDTQRRLAPRSWFVLKRALGETRYQATARSGARPAAPA